MERSDILIVGAGLAGLFLALKLAPRRVLVLSQAPLGMASSSAWAQGGIAAALAVDDNPALHAADTVAAGAGIVDPAIAKLIAEEGPARVMDLIALGVPFDRTADGALAQSLEAAHSRPRVVRVAGDLAGKAIMEALTAAARAAEHISFAENMRATALLLDAHGAVRGVRCYDEGFRAVDFTCGEVVLATGGIGGLYAITTNPPEARGTGLAMAARAGALIADPEFVQFHPTALDLGRDPAPLATEALRGEGAKLVNSAGESFIDEMAPRDEVARAVHRERVAGRGAYLDARAAVGDHFPAAFPTVFAACMAAGVDPRKEIMPIAPAAHYHMGGIVSDTWARSTLDGLSVIGECASTGVHGANRLASNSLLEAIVFAYRAATRLRETTEPAPAATALKACEARTRTNLAANLKQDWRRLMQEHASVDRTKAGLMHALAQLDRDEEVIGDANEIIVMRLVLSAALAREESRGAHFRSDFPHAGTPQRTFLAAPAHPAAA